MLNPIRNDRREIIGFLFFDATGEVVDVFKADTTYAGRNNGTNIYSADGRQISDSPYAIGLLLEDELRLE